MIAIINYGVGNLYSLMSSFKFVGVDTVVTDDPQTIAEASHVVLPGVGAFEDAIAKLREHGLDQVVMREADKGKPLLGICLGMQLLYEASYEYGTHKGLGLVRGSITNMADNLAGSGLKVPHMGWNNLVFSGDSPLLSNNREGDFVYFVHSFYAPVSDATTSYAQYGSVAMTATLQSGNIFGAQFHPEKSGRVGLTMLRTFADIKL